MTVTAFANGDILMAGSLNTHINNRFQIATIDAATYDNNVSGTNITIKDYYVTSGTLATSNKIVVAATLRPDPQSATERTVNFRVAVGPSGTTPTLTTIGSLDLRRFTGGAEAATIICNGSTTVDSSTVPALVRVTAGNPNAGNGNLLHFIMIGGAP